MHGHHPPAENGHCALNPMLYTPPWVASPPQTPVCWAPGCQVCQVLTKVHLHVSPVTCSGLGGHNKGCPNFSEYNFCTHTGKRHGRSSGMRHGWRSSWSGVRTPVRPSVQGPVGEAPATAPFSIPLHHRYRRCDGWRVSSIFPNPNPSPRAPEVTKTKHHLQQRAPSLLPPSAGWRMSSSYSPSACPRKRTRTRVFRAAACCAAAPPCCAKPSQSPVPPSLLPPLP